MKNKLLLAQLVKCHALEALSPLTTALKSADALGFRDVANVLRLKAAMGVDDIVEGIDVPGLRADSILGDLPFFNFAEDFAAASHDYGLRNVVLSSHNADIVGQELDEFELISPPAGLSFNRVYIGGDSAPVVKVAFLVPYPVELIRSGTGVEAIQTVLNRAIAQGLSAALVRRLLPGSGGSYSATSDAAADVRELLGAVSSTGATRPLFCAAPDVAIRAATLIQKVAVFPAMSPQGGEIGGVRCSVSDQLDPGNLLCVNPETAAFHVGSIDLAVSTEASIYMNTAASGAGAQQLVGGWQNGIVWARGILAFSFAQLREDDMSAVLTNIAWANS